MTPHDPLPKKGTKLGPEWVYHNIRSADLAKVAAEGMGGGSFTPKPGFDFGGDAWIAVRRADLRNPTEHGYGHATAIEPAWGAVREPDQFDDPDEPHPDTLPHTVAADRIVVVDNRGRVVAPLADYRPGSG